MLDPIITMNAGGIIQSASDSVLDLFGWTPAELYGKNVALLIPEPRRSGLDRYLDRYRLAAKAKTLKRTRRFDAVRKDGKFIQIELSMSRANLPAHAAPFFIGIIRDVSEDIDVGPDTLAERTRLQDLIMAQTRALATANLRLQLADRLASLGTLAAGLGHDMNNVLLPVRAHLNAIEHAGIADGAIDHLKAVRRSIAYLQHLSDGLHFLALDPDGPGIASDGAGATDLAYWWRQVGDLLRRAVPKHVKVAVSLPKRLPPVSVAPHWLTQAVLNLIVNAGEAIPANAEAGVVRIWATMSDDGKNVRLGVTDNGRGMSQGIRRRALDLFFSTKPRTMGTGLGLPLARNVALRAGGDVEISSEPGRGTTIVLVLPKATLAGKGTKVEVVAAQVAVLSLRDRRSTALITQILMRAGAEVKAGAKDRPGAAGIWVTDPTRNALAAATRLRKRVPSAVVVLLGKPKASAEAEWGAINALVIDPPDDFETMRQVLGEAMDQRQGPASGKPRGAS
ncbi:MAG: PAS domain-containing sensor histidine kinase [Phycisphaerales bacterium]|jgi:PAS domain S-box-containing protein